MERGLLLCMHTNQIKYVIMSVNTVGSTFVGPKTDGG